MFTQDKSLTTYADCKKIKQGSSKTKTYAVVFKRILTKTKFNEYKIKHVLSIIESVAVVIRKQHVLAMFTFYFLFFLTLLSCPQTYLNLSLKIF